MRSSYKQEDVILLLKDITGMVTPQSTKEREQLIQAGRHYCEMLPIEYVPTDQYMQVYHEALHVYAAPVAEAAANLGDRIMEHRGSSTVLVSLARAGIPIGILVKRYIKWKYHVEMPHYSISIIRGRGIDQNAMQYLLDRYEPQQLLFVDGWVGKGAILHELEKNICRYKGVSPKIAVLADPAYVTDLCGTHEDILIPSSCLNCTVSGLISRTFLRSDIIGEHDFHGAVYYAELEQEDLSYEFIHAIEKYFTQDEKGRGRLDAAGMADQSKTAGQKVSDDTECQKENRAYYQKESTGMDDVRNIAEAFGISDINFIKPGIGETTRVLLRRVPWKVLIDEKYKSDRSLRHILRLAEEKDVPIEYFPLQCYKCCGLIKKIADA